MIWVYNEIDIYEHCSRECGKYKASVWWDQSPNNGQADFPGGNAPSGAFLENNGMIFSSENLCEGYHDYGLEWTPDSIKFYLDGVVKQRMANISTHQPLNLILSIDLSAILDCLDNCNLVNEEFPRFHNIDWLKIYKKENEAIHLLIDQNTVCVGEQVQIFSPIYPNATYSWSPNTSSLDLEIDELAYVQILASEMPGFQGDWRGLKVIPLTPGVHEVGLNIDFPGGYGEMKSVILKAYSEPLNQFQIGYSIQGPPYCCYKFYTNKNSSATSYFWSISSPNFGPYPLELFSFEPQLNYCFLPGQYQVSVQASNPCGLSLPYIQYFNLTEIDRCSGILQIQPNPTSDFISISIIDPLTNHVLISEGIGRVEIIPITKRFVQFKYNDYF